MFVPPDPEPRHRPPPELPPDPLTRWRGTLVWRLLAPVVTLVLVLSAWGMVATFGVAVLLEAPLMGLALVASIVLIAHRWARRRGLGPPVRLRRPIPRPADPEHPWARARDRFATVRAELAAHECDPMAVLALPALSDVDVPSTARFVDAFAEAQALHTDGYPGRGHAGRFITAADRAEQAWRAARDAAERIRLSRLTPQERTAVQRVIKLLTTARDSDSEAERLAAYARARSELARLERAGAIHLPRPALAALDADGRGQLPA